MIMTINANTKIGSIIRERADALDAIISISPRFERLRNPVLRKLIATRTSIAAASRIGNCQVTDFFNKLKPLGFEVDDRVKATLQVKKDLPSFVLHLEKDQLTELDVRPVIRAGKDPLQMIMLQVKGMKPGQALKIINTFYPQPLILLLKKQGFDAYVDTIDDNQVDTYFYKKVMTVAAPGYTAAERANDWDKLFKQYKDKLQVVDVRVMTVPGPMMAILGALEKLPEGNALYVYHKRVPVFLLPELKERKFSLRSKEVSEGQVHLLIFKT